MREDERNELGAIAETLTLLRARWLDPSSKRSDSVTTREVGAASDKLRLDNSALLAELEILEAERARIQSLLMGGQAAGVGQIAALAERVERLRLDFSNVMGSGAEQP